MNKQTTMISKFMSRRPSVRLTLAWILTILQVYNYLISKHLSECEHANYIPYLKHIFDNLNDINDSDTNT